MHASGYIVVNIDESPTSISTDFEIETGRIISIIRCGDHVEITDEAGHQSILEGVLGTIRDTYIKR